MSHLWYNHKPLWYEMGGKVPPRGAKVNTSNKSTASTTTGPIDQLVLQRQKPLYPDSLTTKELTRLTIEFIIANNLSFKTALSPTYQKLIKRLNLEILAPTQYYLY